MTHIDQKLQQEAAAALYRKSLAAFVWRVFDELHPGQSTYVPNWHVDAICHELENLTSGRNKRLVVTMPPRCLKSITTAVAYAAWLLGQKPHCKIIVASYGLDLARKHGADCRRIMESKWYGELFPDTRLARGTNQDELKTTAGGSRKAVSIGGAVTGHGADYLIIDDLLKAADATSETELFRAQEYIEGSLLSRFDNPAEGRVVAIQQRLHEMDPAGYLLGKGTYRHLNLPAIAEEDAEIALSRTRVFRRKPGDLLFPQRLGRDVLENMRREMGPAVFNMQYQQNPIAPDGSPLRWEWFGTYEEPLPRAEYQMVVQSWDTGMSADPRRDYSVCTTWGFRENVWDLLDVFRDRLDYPDLKRKALALAAIWEADKVLVEDAATGKPLVQECRKANRSQFRVIRPERDKEVRFNAACAPVEEGTVRLPRHAPWLADFRRELQGFPRARYDDQVDSFSQFLNWYIRRGFSRALGREGRERRHAIRRR